MGIVRSLNLIGCHSPKCTSTHRAKDMPKPTTYILSLLLPVMVYGLSNSNSCHCPFDEVAIMVRVAIVCALLVLCFVLAVPVSVSMAMAVAMAGAGAGGRDMIVFPMMAVA
ncbi:hypothetical protein N7520_003475 [Penicillium odoratum]|uniref:uncharacterized protein n=1 Tax=Penicillium odoratum TaxID=1167516 RepID=UPI0025473ACC|nr:uncharacterized protein N7520_003475 [Penicillium odoratum]KAJ5768916.1 hypothetical protein N7520_003475 [Penicillium odoratum]